MSHLASLETAVTKYLHEVPVLLGQSLAAASSDEQREILLALGDLRAEAAEVVLPLLAAPRFVHAELAVEVMTWSRDPRVGPALTEWAARRVPVAQRAQQRRKTSAPRRSSLPPDVPYKAILRALRGHPSDRTESFLVLASRDWDPMIRAAALSSLGWWEPVERAEVLLRLQESRRDANSEVRQAARGALARLGERQALQWFRQGLTSEEPQRMLDTVQAVAAEGLTLLWPDLDRLADSEDVEISHHAREAIERLGEDLERSWT
jgi:HEAT repeat protein